MIRSLAALAAGGLVGGLVGVALVRVARDLIADSLVQREIAEVERAFDEWLRTGYVQFRPH